MTALNPRSTECRCACHAWEGRGGRVKHRIACCIACARCRKRIPLPQWHGHAAICPGEPGAASCDRGQPPNAEGVA